MLPAAAVEGEVELDAAGVSVWFEGAGTKGAYRRVG